MLQCGLPSMYYINHEQTSYENAALKMFEKAIKAPLPVTDLLKIEGAAYKNGNTMMVLDEKAFSWYEAPYMLGWFGDIIPFDNTAEDGVFLPTWKAKSLDEYNKIVNGELEECEDGIFRGKVWQRSQTIASQETIDTLKRGIERREQSPIINYSLPTYHLCREYENQNACYLLDGVVYYVHGIKKGFNCIEIDDGREFKSGNTVAEPIVLRDIFFEKNNKGIWVGCSNDCCAGIAYCNKESFFKTYSEEYIALQEEMNQLYQYGVLRNPDNTEWEELKKQYDSTNREFERIQAIMNERLGKISANMQGVQPNGGQGGR